MAIYMKFDGIKGDVTAAGFIDQIELDNCSFGVSRDVAMEPGNIKNRESGMPYIQCVSISKQLDSSTPLLLQKALAGAEANNAEIVFVRTGEGGAPTEVGKYILSRAVISDYQFSGTQGAKPQESLSISFTKIECDFSQSDKDNKNGQNVKVGYDLDTAKVL